MIRCSKCIVNSFWPNLSNQRKVHRSGARQLKGSSALHRALKHKATNAAWDVLLVAGLLGTTRTHCLGGTTSPRVLGSTSRFKAQSDDRSVERARTCPGEDGPVFA
ncbi:hypothetical protein NDU88_009480 [Pleurodeles waltl]|uniref:Uncharacterized protein n=1 Tax=Pleurodeles waltl TaxID=8319 RepID=A0AAV7PV32_PLEWA|nr:hypothetical protein NDU88_009480 [Pleurodeles waltl]